MKKVYVDEKWCLGCHLCEYNCAYANRPESAFMNMAQVLKDRTIYPRIRIEADSTNPKITYAVQCRHCTDPICVKSCISGALSKKDGVVTIDHQKCIGCLTCILVCPFGALVQDGDGAVQKCELCLKNSSGTPACVKGCPNRAIVYEDRGES